MMWWGKPWPSETLRADVCADDAMRISVPVGYDCSLCGELIEPGEQGVSMMGIDADGKAYPVQEHIECQMRHVMGCYASIMSHGEYHNHERNYREDAREVWEWIQRHPIGQDELDA